jgi:hypothetical protein
MTRKEWDEITLDEIINGFEETELIDEDIATGITDEDISEWVYGWMQG